MQRFRCSLKFSGRRSLDIQTPEVVHERRAGTGGSSGLVQRSHQTTSCHSKNMTPGRNSVNDFSETDVPTREITTEIERTFLVFSSVAVGLFVEWA